MPWVRFDDQFPIHRGVPQLSDIAYRLYMSGVCWCVRNGCDVITASDLRELVSVRRPAKHAAALVDGGLWELHEDGWRVPRGNEVRDLWSVERDDYRKKIPDWIRELVYERDKYRCVECAATEDLTLDHIYPWSLGGSDGPDNLRTLCRPCNSRKGARV
jgi:hypothetical protein